MIGDTSLINFRRKILYLIFPAVVLSFFLACNGKQEQVEKRSEEEPNIVNAPQLESTEENEKNILFYGNSLTAGYGLEEEESFPYLIQQKLDSADLNYSVVNAGLSGETTAGGLTRIDWVLNQSVDIFVLELGGNDILRGIDVENTQNNLQAIIEKVRERSPATEIILAGMQAPPNMGPAYTNAFNQIYSSLAEEYETGFIPFLLEGVAANPELNLPDGIHPNAKGQKIVAENIWRELIIYLDE